MGQRVWDKRLWRIGTCFHSSLSNWPSTVKMNHMLFELPNGIPEKYIESFIALD